MQIRSQDAGHKLAVQTDKILSVILYQQEFYTQLHNLPTSMEMLLSIALLLLLYFLVLQFFLLSYIGCIPHHSYLNV